MTFKRHTKEEIFHDSWAESIGLDKVMVNESFEACTAPENRYILKSLGNLKEKKVLELGCGAGEASVYLAKQKAEVTAIDISSGMLAVVQQLANKYQVHVTTRQAASDSMDFDDSTFDIVYAANLLHHVEIEPTVKEARRVLKKGGFFVSWDPLAYNPIINIYRRMATDVRTEDEHPLTMADLDTIRSHFADTSFRMTWFFTLWLFCRFFLFERSDPNKERYWKKILVEHKRLEKQYKKLEKMDHSLLSIFPFLRRFCWNVTVIAKK